MTTTCTISRGNTSVTFDVHRIGGDFAVGRDAGKPHSNIYPVGGATTAEVPRSEDNRSAADGIVVAGQLLGANAYSDAQTLAESLIGAQTLTSETLQLDIDFENADSLLFDIGVPDAGALDLSYPPGRQDVVDVEVSAGILGTREPVQTLLDDFEDGDQTVIPTDTWTGWTAKNEVTFTVISSGALDGSFSGKGSSDSDIGNRVVATRDTAFEPSTFTTLFKPLTSVDGDEGLRVQLRRDADNIMNVEFLFDAGLNAEREIRVNGGVDKLGNWDIDTVYKITISNMDFTAGEWDLTVEENATGTVVVDETNLAMNSATAINKVVYGYDWERDEAVASAWDNPTFKPNV